MTKNEEELIKTLNERIEHAETAERITREELEDVQRENMRLRGWQDCAREILGSSQRVTIGHKG